MRKQTWKWGDKHKLAKKAGISDSHLCDIMHGRKNCDAELATKLAKAAERLSYYLPPRVWVFKEDRKQFKLFPKQN